MKLRAKLMIGVCAALAAMTSFAKAEDKAIDFIQCGDSEDPVYPPIISAWESAHPGFKIHIEVVPWDTCQDKVTTLSAAGNPPALAYVGSRTLKQLANNDLIIPVPMTDAEKAAYYPNIPDTVTFKGNQWGIPTAFSTKSLYWNKDLFKKAGLDPEKPPTTWAEELADAKAIKEKAGVAGFGVVAKTYDNTMHQFMHWVYTNNGKVIDKDGKIVLDSPENLEALTALNAMVPYAEDGPTAYEQLEVRAIFLDGKLGMTQQSVGAVNLLKDAKFAWGVAPLPLGPHAKGPGTLLITDSLAIFKGTGVEAQATDFAKFLTNPDNQFKYEVSNGLTPLRPVPGVKDLVEKDPHWKPFIDGIAYGGPEPLFQDYKGFQNTMIDMVQSVVTGKAKPADALKKAAADLEQYK
ncbi:ABC transporter substrate-binding protein [Methylovirgula sp. 4M-Z18]|uniref:ABC transporter substrate-binding protein n=1 Tax=Methylovirgula sp. 4M-Z18 TaxID=2293567 RepID=UPI000E2FE1A2|nr:extracellular solute-binding protein [Methylovirgula sp. 4M-Z18]RFB80323.1 extracellular solute-binding protein [Methylovirgula sp. 4M-Z18]